MPERGVDTAPLTFYLSEESRVGLLHTPTRVPLSLSLSLSRSSSRFLSLSFSLLLSPISLSLSGYSGKSMFLRYFLFPSGACKTRVTGCGYLSSLPLPSPFPICPRKGTSVTDRTRESPRIPERSRRNSRARRRKGMTKEGKGSSRREGRKTVKREGKRIRSRRASITIEEEEKGERERRRRRRRGRERSPKGRKKKKRKRGARRRLGANRSASSPAAPQF